MGIKHTGEVRNRVKSREIQGKVGYRPIGMCIAIGYKIYAYDYMYHMGNGTNAMNQYLLHWREGL